MIVLKIASLVVWLLLVPFCLGLVPVYFMSERDRTPGTALVAGYLVTFALFELVGIPVELTLVYHSFTALSRWFEAACLLLSALGAGLTVRRSRKGQETALLLENGWKSIGPEEKIGYLIFLALLGFQMYMAFTRASFDGDDAYYVVQGGIAQQMDSLYRINPYTGRSAPLDVRHAMALMPIWQAFVGRMSGIHATVMAHSVIPLLFLPLTYLLYWQIGRKLLRNKPDMLPMFMILLALFQMFGNVSIYTNETFFLTRTWQGKSLSGNFILPAVYWLFLCMFDQEEGGKKAGCWVLLGVTALAGGAGSSLAVLLVLSLTAGLGLLFALRERSLRVLLQTALSCLPGAAYILVYIIIGH